MRKQSPKQRKGRRQFGSKNSNYRLPASVSERIEALFEGIDGGQFDLDYLKSEFSSKLCLPEPGAAQLRKDRAIEKWLETESKNANTNTRFREVDPEYNILPRVTFRSFLRFARHLTREVLGELSDELSVGTFSGGASTSRKRTESHPAQKFVGKADVTEEAMYMLTHLWHAVPLLNNYAFGHNLTVVPGAKLFTVPKKTDIDRCACKEPDINMFLQKASGRYIRRRLLRFGINLNDQSINRRLAAEGSRSGLLATLDLSSASDTITIECVRALLPTEWFEYLNSIRSQTVEVRGNIVRTEMFSSMGNGFTFELESLIFWVLMRTVAYFEGIKGVISVYGDDIIIPSGMYNMATWALHEFGFSVNPDKSFSTGPFRESCGGHYHNGDDVTPFYLRKPPSRLTDLIRVTNQLRRWALADPGRQYMHPWVFPLWAELRDLVPRDLWGGRDTEIDTQLVTPDFPSRVLTRGKSKKELPAIGQYLLWHASVWNRSPVREDAPPDFKSEDTTTFCRRRRAKPGAPYLDRIFQQEI